MMGGDADAASRGQRLGRAVGDVRRERGFSQRHLATSSGVALDTLRKLEQGHVTNPRVFHVAALAAALGVDLDQLVRGANTPTVLSFGYEGQGLHDFLEFVTASGVEYVADVRLTPISRKAGFSKTRLREELAAVDVDYVHFRSLGNRKENRPLFAGGELEVGRARYRAGLRAGQAQVDLDLLAETARLRRVALLCFERDDRRCHRSVVAEELAQLG